MGDIYGVIVGSIIIVIVIILSIIETRNKKKQRKKLMEGKGAYIDEIHCDLILGESKALARLALLRNFQVDCDLLLYNDRIVFATIVPGSKNWQPEIMIKDIKCLKMERVLWKDILFFHHETPPGKPSGYEQKFYIGGALKEELLYIKDFVEKRKKDEAPQN